MDFDKERALALRAVEMALGANRPGVRISERDSDTAEERFIVLSSRGIPRLMLPRRLSVMRSALRAFGSGRRLIGLAPAFIRGAAKIGYPLSSRVEEIAVHSDSHESTKLRNLLNSVLDRTDFHLALRLSFGRPNAKTVVAAIANSGEILCFAKLGSEPMTNQLIAHEGAVLERFMSAESPVLMPRALHTGSWGEGCNVLVTAPLELEPLPRNAREAHLASDALAVEHGVTTTTLRDSKYWHTLVTQIEALDPKGPSREDAHTAMDQISAKWGDRVFDFSACHGDWSRANVGLVNGRIAAHDWERFSELAPRGIDTAHFAVLEEAQRSRRRPLDAESVARLTARYLTAANRPSEDAKPLVLIELLEMVLRFKAAKYAGLQATDTNFGPALNTGLGSWLD